ncbi:transposase [Streptomyces sp. NPDC057245]|uniref:transposase n=1 Tax=Streptomyces sp. NPDC057245 TaxID=3346065 RepID=UPI0036386298
MVGGDAGDGTVRDTDGRQDTGGWSRELFVEEVGLVWEGAGSGRMDGRIVAYLLITDVPYVSSAELARELKVSAGSVSLATRRLVEAGFIRRHAVPGRRGHYFRVDDDVWGSFLAGERRHLDRQEELAVEALALLGPEEEAPRRRLGNMRDYMRWIRGSHHDLLTQWKAYQAQADDVVQAREGRGVSAGEHAGVAVSRAEAPRGRSSAALDPALARRLVPDVLWEVAASLLPAASEDERAALTAVVYVLTSGCGWQQLPSHFGVSHSTAHRRFTAWSEGGLWQRWPAAAHAAQVDAADLSWCELVSEAAVVRRTGSRM